MRLPRERKGIGRCVRCVFTTCRVKGMGHLECKFQGEGWSSTNDFWRQKTIVPGLSRGVVCVIIRLAVLTQYRRVTDKQTDTHT